MAPSNANDRIIELAEVMRKYSLTRISVAGFDLTMDPRGFAAQPIQTMAIPPHEVPKEAAELFRELTDEELLMQSAAPLPEAES